MDTGPGCGGEPCLRSGAIPDGGFSITFLTIWPDNDTRYDNATNGDRVSFDVNVSSQLLGDKLTFTMGAYADAWSGKVPWKRVSYEIPQIRPIILQWEYRKDTTIAVGADTAWIRRIIVE
ncbi:MAG: hypothetical protein IIC99_09030 [Chloroflexi bacterium]|nr:hypothetical protein [Chloroflexota bacterium]